MKFKHIRISRINQFINNLFEIEFNNIIKIIKKQIKKWKLKLMIKIKIIVFVDKDKVCAKSQKQFWNDRFFDFFKNETSFSKFIRTDKLLDQTRQRVLIFKKINSFEKRFIDCWQCHDVRCCNYFNEFCFINHKDVYYNMKYIEQARWAKILS